MDLLAVGSNIRANDRNQFHLEASSYCINLSLALKTETVPVLGVELAEL